MKPWLNRFKNHFKDKKVLILGLGLLGRGVEDARFFAKMGAKVTVTDLKSEKELKPSLSRLKNLPIDYVLGRHRKKDILENDFVIRNAGVPKESRYLQLARKNNVPVYMDEALFCKYAPVKTIGITGTRGKSTTTELIYRLLKRAGFSVWIGGNIRGKATLPLLEKVDKDDWVIMELSSWQLQGFEKFKISPHIAVWTNILEDHLNRYCSMENYINDKKIIYRYQKKEDLLLVNKDNKELFKKIKSDKNNIASKIVFFEKKDYSDCLKKSVQLKGRHNMENIAGVFAVAGVLDVDIDIVIETIKRFKGLPGRLEKIATFNGVLYVNDTTSTTPAAGIAALDSFVRPIILIAGGSSKNLTMDAFAKKIVKRVKKVIFLQGGETINLINLVKKFSGEKKIAGNYNSLDEAVVKAQNLAQEGDIVLLSPGCASFGMFKNEFDRGKKFIEAVGGLKNG